MHYITSIICLHSMSSYFSTVAQESLCLLKFFHNTRILSPLSSLEALLQLLSCKVTVNISFSLTTYFGDGFFGKINRVYSRAIWIIMHVAYSPWFTSGACLPHCTVHCPPSWFDILHQQCKSALLHACSQSRGSLLGWDVQKEGHTHWQSPELFCKNS